MGTYISTRILNGFYATNINKGFPGGSMVKNLPANAGHLGSIPGLGRFPGEENGNPFQYSCQENSMDKEAWWAIVMESQKSLT